MGYATHLQVLNARSESVTLTVADQKCMFDRGDQGSNVHAFDQVTLAPGERYPSTPQYVEEQGSGDCAAEPSWFEIQWVGGEPVGGGGSFTIGLTGGLNNSTSVSSDPWDAFAFTYSDGDWPYVIVVVL